jgi:GNAT superfamily N-acetyltransferase
MSIQIRPAEIADLEAAVGIAQRSINDLRVKHGFAPTMGRGAPRFQAFSLADDPRGLWVARSGGMVVGFGFSWICDHFWFLAQLFVEPNIQHKGLGRALLGKALEQSEACNATNRALITFAYSPF